MMTKNFVYFSAIALALSGVSLVTADAQVNKAVIKASDVVAVDAKVCYIDMNDVMGKSEIGKKETAELQAKFKEFSNELQTMQKNLAQAAKDWDAKKAAANEETRAKETSKLAKMQRDAEARMQECDEQFRLMQQKAAERVTKQVDAIVAEYARNNNFDSVVDKVTGRVIFASNKVDRTSDIIVAMNKVTPAATVVAKDAKAEKKTVTA